MVKSNNIIPNAHFKKHWERIGVKTWFNQPARKHRRRVARQAKAAKIAPRPVAGALRPVVRCQTVRYNTRVRAGRGFSLDELKAAGVSAKLAPTIGIAVDHRRTNKSQQSLQENVARLKQFLSKLVVFPRKSNKAPKKGDSSPEETAAATQFTGAILPISQPSAALELVAKPEASHAYRTLRQERCNARIVGIRAKKAKEAAEKAPAKDAGEAEA